jgi:hypothetical protein
MLLTICSENQILIIQFNNDNPKVSIYTNPQFKFANFRYNSGRDHLYLETKSEKMLQIKLK